MAGTYKSFEDLECWKAGREVRFFFKEIIKQLPKEEKFSLSSQIRRASRSVTNNIAEGFGRFHYQENIQFCRSSRGSLHELVDHLIICKEDHYIKDEEYKKGRELLNKAIAILNGYINYLIRTKKENKSKDNDKLY
jgi:four helix bundle protein